MANPYSHSYDERWSDGQATTTERLNIAREGVDFVAWALAAGGISGEGEVIMTWEAPLIWTTGDGGADLFFAIWIDITGAMVRYKTNVGSAPVPSAEDDGNAAFLQASTGTGPGF